MASDAGLATTASARAAHEKPGVGWWVMTIPALLIATYGVYFIFGTPPGDPAVKARIMSTPAGLMHILGGLVGMALGPFQFLDGLRRNRPAVHR